jgi:integrase
MKWPPARVPTGVLTYRDGYRVCMAGKVIHLAGRGATYAQVMARLAAVTAERPERVTRPVKSDLTLGDAINAYLAHVEFKSQQGITSERTAINHHYELKWFMEHVGDAVALSALGPAHFGSYRRAISAKSEHTIRKAMACVGSFMRWCERAEHIDRIRFGPDWLRPRQTEIRSARAGTTKTIGPAMLRRLWNAADPQMRAWIALGIVGGFTPSDIAHLTRECIDGNVIDFRRRKTGRVRRVIPLPADVLELLPRGKGPLVFTRDDGSPWHHNSAGTADSGVTYHFRRVVLAHGLRVKFTGLRTTHYNITPREFRDERAVVMGRARGTIDLDFYAESEGLSRLSEFTEHLWWSFGREVLGSEAPADAWPDAEALAAAHRSEPAGPTVRRGRRAGGGAPSPANARREPDA